MLNQLKHAVSHLKKKKPLVLCLTNYVTLDFMANVLLAIGALPLMSESEAEITELVAISNSINLNIGTLNTAFIKRADIAIQTAQQHQKPLILDPVGAGASHLRTSIAQQYMSQAILIRGNASEILSLGNVAQQTQGVDAVHTVSDATETARHLANIHHTTIIVSGKTDFVTDGLQQQSLPFGSAIMPQVVGMGCTLTAVVAAFKAIIPNAFEAATLATAYFGLCGQLTEKTASRPGSFRMQFIDTLSQPDWTALQKIWEEIYCENQSTVHCGI